METTTSAFALLASLASDLTASLTAADRYDRLVAAVRGVLPCDATMLLRCEGDTLVPLASHGLRQEALGRRYPRAEHPRLDIICRDRQPTRFPPDSTLPDPFDGMLAEDAEALRHIHACLGCPLWVEDHLVGVLTADALEPHAFDEVEEGVLRALAALAGAAMRTAALIEALEERALRQEDVVRDLMRDVTRRRGGLLLGRSAAMARLRDEIRLVGRTDYPVLVHGETGTGKELVVRALHAASPRAHQPLIYLNCAALPASIAESELFGHLQGAFTGADRHRPGKFEVADGGTLFLDEVGELPLAVQPKLLRALQEGEIQRVGADRTHRVDVRVLAATNRELEGEVEAGRFRADLYHRLAVYAIAVPPLRARADDVALLAGAFLDDARRHLGLGPVRLTRNAARHLAAYAWPGNVRELENVVSRAVLRASGGVARGAAVLVRPEHLGHDFQESPRAPAPAEAAAPGTNLREAVDAFQRDLIQEAVARHGGSWAAAARDLGLHRSNLHRLAARLGLRASRPQRTP
jgi:anaerobic nitric oxide reductase transcription regulator